MCDATAAQFFFFFSVPTNRPRGNLGTNEGRIERTYFIWRMATESYAVGRQTAKTRRMSYNATQRGLGGRGYLGPVPFQGRRRGTRGATARDTHLSESESTVQVNLRSDPKFSATTESLSNLTPLNVENVYDRSTAVTCPEDLEAILDSSLTCGISSTSSAARVEAFGSNITPSPEPVTILELVIEALSDFTVLTLIGAAGVSITLEVWLAAKEGRDANIIESISILIAVAVVVLVSAGNNWQKEKQFQALEKVSSRAFVRAVRDGTEVRLPAEDVVVGEVLKLETGDILCADGVLLQGFDIRVDESHLTGESREVSKDARTSQAMYSGSKVLSGVGTMMVTAVGRSSQSGIIADLTMMSGRKKGGSDENDPAPPPDEPGGPMGFEESTQTTLQKQLEVYASNIGKIGLVAAVSTTLAMGIKFSIETFVVQGQPWSVDYLETYLGFFITGVTILVVAIPEGLPLAVTISLAYSVKRMLEENNLVRHLSAAETMGTATVICTDKTGTLTQNVMTVQNMWFDGKMMAKETLKAFRTLNSPSKLVLAQAIALNSTAKIFTDDEGTVQRSGNKTELALLELLNEWRHDKGVSISEDCKRLETDVYTAVVVEQQPFTSESKRMSSLVEYQYKFSGDSKYPRRRLFIKGAAEVILRQCSKVLVNGAEEVIETDDRQAILDAMHGDSRSLRLLAIAYKDMCDEGASGGGIAGVGTPVRDGASMATEDLVLLAVLGIADPLRPEVPEAISKARHAGISVRMFTGDNPVTAASIATECGIMSPSDALNPRAVVEGSQFMKNISSYADDEKSIVAFGGIDSDGNGHDGVSPVVDKEKFLEHWRDLKVLARCSPADKFVVVEALKKYTEDIVAVTGDGTNDAPALRKAHVGFAMNDGTQIAKEAADIILVDNNFASTINAALWGRNVYSNITKFLQFQLTVNIVALITAAGGALASAESPLTTVQMLWVNLIMDSLASLALATGRPDPMLLNEKPYGKDHNFVDPRGPLPKHIIGQAIYQLAVLAWLLGPAPDALGIPHHIAGNGPSIHHTLVFNTFVMMQLFNQLNARVVNDSEDILDNIKGETLFQWVLCSEFILQVVIVQYGAVFFNTTGLSLEAWGVSIGFGLASLVLRKVLSSVALPV